MKGLRSEEPHMTTARQVPARFDDSASGWERALYADWFATKLPPILVAPADISRHQTLPGQAETRTEWHVSAQEVT